jgi:hypothetical protein
MGTVRTAGRARASVVAGYAFVHVLLIPLAVEAHPGGTDANGCHAGSQPYHCHGGGSAPVAPVAPLDRSTLTTCNDGSVSRSTGPGTCSHHGGIAGNVPSTDRSGPSTSTGSGEGRIIPGVRAPDLLVPAPMTWWQRNADGVYVWAFWGAIGWFGLRKWMKEPAPARSAATGWSAAAPPSTPTRPMVHKADVVSVMPRDIPAAFTVPKQSRALGRCRCGGPEVMRRNGRTGQRFVGCSRYPRCRRTRSFREQSRRS